MAAAAARAPDSGLGPLPVPGTRSTGHAVTVTAAPARWSRRRAPGQGIRRPAWRRSNAAAAGAASAAAATQSRLALPANIKYGFQEAIEMFAVSLYFKI
jgi:hypothetical protein